MSTTDAAIIVGLAAIITLQISAHLISERVHRRNMARLKAILRRINGDTP